MSLLSWLLPHRCPYCDTVITGQQTECDHCRAQFPDGVYVRSLSEGVCIAPFGYDGAVRESILRMKKDGLHTRANSFGRRIGQMVRSMGIAPDIVTSIPMYPPDQRQRGFNQAELLAEEISSLLKIPMKPALVERVRPTTAQKELGAYERRKNLKKAFKIGQNDVKLDSIIVVDDIFTTGSTIDGVARVLKEAGAKKVYAATLAIGMPKK